MKTLPIKPFFFTFENDFVNTLKCVPMIVRYKLDSCGIKLRLAEWAKFSLEDKKALAYMPCYTAREVAKYGDYVKKIVRKHYSHEASTLTFVDDSWNKIHEIPVEVQKKAAEWDCPEVTLKNWMNMDTLQRFALVKLSRSGHEGQNFPVALKEFGGFEEYP